MRSFSGFTLRAVVRMRELLTLTNEFPIRSREIPNCRPSFNTTGTKNVIENSLPPNFMKKSFSVQMDNAMRKNQRAKITHTKMSVIPTTVGRLV